MKVPRQKFVNTTAKNFKRPRQKFVDIAVKVCYITAEVEEKFKQKGTGKVPVRILRQRHKMVERDAHEEEEGIHNYFSKVRADLLRKH